MSACSQGGAEFPTGGKRAKSRKPASGFQAFGSVSRSGAIPEPTVIVRMEENVQTSHG
jgi:hypothetical protein